MNVFLNLIQSFSNVLCKDLDTIVILKWTNEHQPFHESKDFKCVTKKPKWLDTPDVKTHYHKIKATKSLHCYVLESYIVIDHKSKTFINHVEHTLDEIDFSFSMKELIVPKCNKTFFTNEV